MAALRLLVLDAYDAAGRAALAAAGGTAAGTLYARMLRSLAPDAAIEILHPADPAEALPDAEGLRRFDGVAWTGSNLSVTSDAEPVRRQLALARAALAAGVPSFGSCYAIQLAAVAAGGACGASPRGREFGVARRIELSASGRRHPLFEGKPPVFDAWTSHADEVVRVPTGATVLAGNAWSAVQALVVRAGQGEFWAVQYHPEYDPHEVASLCALREGELVAQGTFATPEAAEAWRDGLERVHAGAPPGGELALEDALLDPAQRRREVRNWLAHGVRREAR